MDPLCYDDLNLEEKIYLEGMTKHPGFKVMEKLLFDACKKSTDAVVKLDPTSDSYRRQLPNLQIIARVTNDVCGTLLKSIAMHGQSGQIEQQLNQATQAGQEAQTEQESPETPSSVLGSIKIKPERASWLNKLINKG